MSPENKFRTREIALKGRLRTADDPATIAPEDVSVQKNMRPSDQYPRGIGGMTKINTSALASTGIRNGFHFRKSQPSESHVLAWTSDGKVWKYDGSIPAQGAFALLFTDTAGGSTGRFADAPGGALAYANGIQACLWGGTEHRCSGFIDYPATDKVYDYSDLITNTKTDSDNIATIHADRHLDTDTVLLLHLDNNITDSSPATPHLPTNVNVTYSTSIKKFGTHSAEFNGTSAYITVPDNADFDFSAGGSDGAFTVETWCYGNGIRKVPFGTFFSLAKAGAGTDYIRLYRDSTTGELRFEVWIASSKVVNIAYPLFYSSGASAAWSHIEVVGSKSGATYYYYLFLNGSLVGYATHTAPPTAGDRPIVIGAWDNGATIADFLGYTATTYLDEFCIFATARHTESFSVPSSAYGDEYVSTTYIGSIMPLDGVKFTVATGNPLSSGTATMEMFEWDGEAWSKLAITDNTAVSSRALEQTGTVTWASTADSSRPTVVEKVYLYWYKMVITSASDFSGVTISKVSVSIPFQSLKDIWDGAERPADSVIGYKSSVYYDYTTNVLEDGFTSTGSTVDASTYANLGGYTSSDYVYVGSIERLAGLILNIIDSNVNTTPSVMSVDYWDGDAWTPLAITDGTANGTRTLGKSGWVTWDSPARANEFKKSNLGTSKPKSTTTGPAFGPKTTVTTPGVTKNVASLYYYRIGFSATLSANTNVYHIAGIAAAKDIRGYSFPVFHQNRPVLVSNTDGTKNTILMGASNTANVFNGLDAYEFPFGKETEINAAASLFLRFGSAVQDILVLTKQDEVHLLEGNGSNGDPYRTRLLSENVGCRAPLTMVTIPVGDLGGGVRRQIAIWESQRGIEVFDGSALMDPLLSHDIRDKFDPNHANFAGSSANTGFYDAVYDEYHWCPVGSAEWVFSFKYKKWYQSVRGTGKYLYGGIPVMDTSGNSYVFGFDNAGYVYRLENGTDFDGNDIVHTLKTGAISLDQNQISQEVTLRYVKVVQVAKNTTANLMTVTVYQDTDPTGNSIGTINLSATKNKSGVGRLRSAILNAQSKGSNTHFEFGLTNTTDNETCGCEPIYIVAYYDGERQDVR